MFRPCLAALAFAALGSFAPGLVLLKACVAGWRLLERVVTCAMSEFLVRWLLVGGVCVGALAAAGVRAGGFLGWLLAGLWLGFCNAALRPVVLRVKWRAWALPAALLVVLAALNTLLFVSASSWLPLSGSPEPLALVLAIAAVTACSFGVSVRFRAHDGQWHWITYHGSVTKKG